MNIIEYLHGINRFHAIYTKIEINFTELLGLEFRLINLYIEGEYSGLHEIYTNSKSLWDGFEQLTKIIRNKDIIYKGDNNRFLIFHVPDLNSMYADTEDK